MNVFIFCDLFFYFIFFRFFLSSLTSQNGTGDATQEGQNNARFCS